jgi:hypothetical protein
VLANAAHRLLQRSMQFAGGGLNPNAAAFAPPPQQAYGQQGFVAAQPGFAAAPQQQMYAAPYAAQPYGYAPPQQQQQMYAQQLPPGYAPYGAQPYGYAYPPQQQQQQAPQQQAPPGGGDNRFAALGNLPRRDPRAR